MSNTHFSSSRLSDDDRVRLLTTQTECTIGWLNAEGWPVSAVQTYVFDSGAFWLTSFRDRPRVSCLTNDPRSSVAVSSAGTPLGPERMVSTRTLAVIHDDDDTAKWFYPRFCQTIADSERSATAMAQALAQQDRVVIELRPQSWNSFDGTRLRRSKH